MPRTLEPRIQKWVEARVIDLSTAERIRAFEDQEASRARSWPMIVAIIFGALMLSAGILLFVAAHWDQIAPWSRFWVVMAGLALLHAIAIASSTRAPQLSMTMHAVATAACGAGIFLTGQIFNLQEHWPTGILLWALAAWSGWALLRQWPQASLAAMLSPAWLFSEWGERVKWWSGAERITAEGALLLAIVYIASRAEGTDSTFRKSLNWIGGLCLFPAYLTLSLVNWATNWHLPGQQLLPFSYRVLGRVLLLGAPLVFAWIMRQRESWPCGVALFWVLGVGQIASSNSHSGYRDLLLFVWGALGAAGLIAWGVSDRIKNRINLGMVLFVVALLTFYFSNLLDKFGRSLSLISFGTIFLLAGYFLEKTRRRLVAHIQETVA